LVSIKTTKQEVERFNNWDTSHGKMRTKIGG
jgi:hypothetical protein